MEWSGGGLVGPGLSTFYFASGASGFVADLATFFAAQNNRFSDQITWSCSNTGDEIDDTDGSITGVWTDGTSWSSGGSSSGAWAAGTGGRVKWVTAGINRGRRIHGTTFLVPLYAAAYNNGFIDSGVVSGFQSAVNALVSAQSGDFMIWSRPRSGMTDGLSSAVTSGVFPAEVTTLRSRRT